LINEKTEQTFIKTTVWNSNQFRSSNFRTLDTSIKTFNLDSIKEQLMKKEKCFNCDEFDHLNKDCSKLKKFKIAEINVRNETKNSRKE
jgi:hypothetical protein